MAQAKSGDTVQVHYTGKLDDGRTFDSSVDREPLEFTLGERQVIPGFESAVVGMEPGERKTVTIAAADAYGPSDPELVVQVERQDLPEGLDPHVGQQLQVTRPDGVRVPVLVTEVSDASITIDANHPLAGEDLTFEITLVQIQ
ncbi:MAG: peptidylprolyl isomerase [Deferrisomatales bacterium]